VKNSLDAVTALAPKVGYDKARTSTHHATMSKKQLSKLALKLGYLTREEI